ncbi:hypothetical protein [Prevotella sp. E2-28]|uniref:hypothetical protein n=1 Tax=Prevotella sp. E2-28 TaxID=2913620 RepID=UPI001EDBE847|nr:hypothetical protein [Prevotella sp. E2-28]UKK53167.1 hypothetical protein L6465_11325 [Prevotella sp. E2-28]
MKKLLISATLFIGMMASAMVFDVCLSSCSSTKKVIVLAPSDKGSTVYDKDTTIPKGEAFKQVTRDNPGSTALEKTIIRWYFDSEPRGARVFWRVVSSVPEQVKNTNETYLGTTPYEDTRSFNILGLTYENSRDVQVEIKVVRSGYMEQMKRFNVRQAIDQMEIGSFFELIKKDAE